MKPVKTQWLCRDKGLLAFTTVKPVDAEPDRVAGIVSRILAQARAGPAFVCFARQVHGARVLVPRSVKFKPFQAADGFVTATKGCLLAIFTADCLPVILYDRRTGTIGAVHCGWKGTYKEIAGRAVRKMQKCFGARPGDIRVMFGPSIHECCYEVGADLAAKFARKFGRACVTLRDGRHYLSIAKANEIILTRLGVKKRNITKHPHCTFCRKDLYYSYRRDGKGTGRMATCVVMPVQARPKGGARP